MSLWFRRKDKQGRTHLCSIGGPVEAALFLWPMIVLLVFFAVLGLCGLL